MKFWKEMSIIIIIPAYVRLTAGKFSQYKRKCSFTFNYNIIYK